MRAGRPARHDARHARPTRPRRGAPDGPIALRTSRSSGTQDGQLDIQIANGPELAPEDPEPAELIAHDRLLERAPEYPPAAATPGRGAGMGVASSRALASARPPTRGGHPEQWDPRTFPAGVAPRSGAANSDGGDGARGSRGKLGAAGTQ